MCVFVCLYSWNLNMSCNAGCNCGLIVKYEPICSIDKTTTFYSPCHAGCTDVAYINGAKVGFHSEYRGCYIGQLVIYSLSVLDNDHAHILCNLNKNFLILLPLYVV